MKNKTAFALVTLFMTSGMAQAQKFSEEKSYNRASVGLSTLRLKDTFKDGTERSVYCFDDEKIWMKGVDINYLHGFRVTSKMPLYLEVGGRLTYDTHRDSYMETYYHNLGSVDEETIYHFSIFSFSVPANVSYKYIFKNGAYIAPYVGIHFRLNLFGKIKEKEENTYGHKESATYKIFKSDEEGFWEEDGDHAKRFQFGGQVGVNVGYKVWNLGIAYYLDTPLEKYVDDVDSEYNWKYKQGGIAITVGYNF